MQDPNLSRAVVWLAGKIESSWPDKSPLERTPQTIELVRERYNAARAHARLPIPPQQETPFFEALL